ncbi:MAG: AAA family ATPase [candidate division NC10 bacterium]|nr:AAA family ATPase [candidate division NC10 bacterium]
MKRTPITFNDLARVGMVLDPFPLDTHGSLTVPPEVFKRLPIHAISLLMNALYPPDPNKVSVQGVVVADEAATDLTFLWPGRFVQGNLNILVGDPGTGKSFLTLDMIARVSRGAPWPDGGAAPKGNSLLISGEDVTSDTIRPRLEKHNADLSRIKIIDRVECKARSSEGQLRLPDHIDALADEVRRVQARILVIDPITSFLGVKDDHRMTVVRSALTPLKQMADEHDLTVILITHANKQGDKPPIYRVSGSIAYVAAARMISMLGMDPDNEHRRIFAPVTKNFKTGPPLAFSFVEVEDVHPRIEWEPAPVSVDLTDLLAGTPEREPGAMAKALDFLQATLGDGPVPSRDLSDAADRARISQPTLKRARQRLGIEAVQRTTGDWWAWWPGHGERPGSGDQDSP